MEIYLPAGAKSRGIVRPLAFVKRSTISTEPNDLTNPPGRTALTAGLFFLIDFLPSHRYTSQPVPRRSAISRNLVQSRTRKTRAKKESREQSLAISCNLVQVIKNDTWIENCACYRYTKMKIFLFGNEADINQTSMFSIACTLSR